MGILALTNEELIDVGISIGIILATVIIGRWLIGLILDRVLRRLVGRTRTDLDDVILDSLRPAIYFLSIVIAAQLSIARLDFFPSSAVLDNVFFILYFLTAFIFAWTLIASLFAWYWDEVAPRTETELDEQLVPFFRRILQIILAAVGIIVLLSYFDVDVSGLVATLGIGSLAIALAAQETLADSISGFVIMVDRPFRIGDRIEIQDLDTWGDVVDIGLRSSRIRTRDNRMVIVPNSVISKSLIVNYSYPNNLYRIEIHVGVAYGTDLEHARKVIVDAVRPVEGVSPDHPVEALFLEFGDSALVFRVRWWLEDYVDTRRMFDLVNTEIYNALLEHEIEIPFPQRDVHLIKNS